VWFGSKYVDDLHSRVRVSSLLDPFDSCPSGLAVRCREGSRDRLTCYRVAENIILLDRTIYDLLRGLVDNKTRPLVVLPDMSMSRCSFVA
jgi:hypothetical protein